MRSSLLLAFCALVAIDAPVVAKEKTKAASEAVVCEGVFGPQSSEALLIETFGADNVVTGDLPGPEGTTLLGTTVYPDNENRRMEFFWWDEEELAGLSDVELSRSSKAPGGVRIGMTVAEVTELNGEPFTIGGFWWDYGGYASFESGTLADLPGECYLSVRFSPAEEYSGAIDVTPVSGEVVIPSDEGLLEILDVRVGVLSLGYASPDAEPDGAD
jgi:hypothetical protein